MAETLLPLFPLDAVLLPGAPLPLHIFEERYKEMIGEAVENGTEFGIVQAGEKGILNIGCTATVERVIERYDDGRMDILTIGRRRFEIVLLDQQKSYLRAAVTFFDDDDETAPSPDAEELGISAMKLIREILTDEPEPTEMKGVPLSFQIARYIDDAGLRQTLLAMRSEAARLKHLGDFVPEWLARERRILHGRRVAALNGHGHPSSPRRDTEE